MVRPRGSFFHCCSGTGLVAFVLLLAAAAWPHGEAGTGNSGGGGALPNPLGRTACVGGFAAVYPCANAELWAYLPLSALGGSGTGNDLWGWTDPQSGREFVLFGRSDGTAFVEVSDPAAPRYLGKLPTASGSSFWRDIKVYRHYALIVSEAPFHGLQIFDLRRLLEAPPPSGTFSADVLYNRFSNAHNLVVNEDTASAFVVGSNTCSGGLHRIDLRDPLTPRFAGCFAADGYTHDAQCVLYHGPDARFTDHELCFCANEDSLTIVDWTDPDAPVLLSRTDYSGRGYTHQGWLTPDHAFFLLDDEFDETLLPSNTRTYVWDVRNPLAPFVRSVFVNSTPAIDHNQYVVEWDGRWFVFQANYRSGLRVLEFTDRARAELAEVAFFDVYPQDDLPAYNGAWSVYPFFPSRTVAVSGIEQGLFLVRVQPPTNPGQSPPPTSPLPQSTPSPTPTPTATPSPLTVAVQGSVRALSSADPLPAVAVSVAHSGSTATLITDSSGQFTAAVPVGSAFRIEPHSADHPGAALSPADAVAILRYITGLEPLSSPQFLAADTNGSGTISAADAVHLLRYLVGLEPRLQAAERCGSDWLFFPSAADPTLERSPSFAGSTCTRGALAGTAAAPQALAVEFAALPIGDVNASWRPTLGTCRNERCPAVEESPAPLRLGRPRSSGGSERTTIPLRATRAGSISHFLIETTIAAPFGPPSVQLRLTPRWRGAITAAHAAADGTVRVAAASSDPLSVRAGETVGWVVLGRPVSPAPQYRARPRHTGVR